jgi:membrane protein
LISNRVREFYQRADRISGNRLTVLKDAIETFTVTRANQAAAGLAYYVIFSLFPLLLVLISAGSYFVSTDQVYQKLLSVVQTSIPGSYTWIDENLSHVLEARGAVGIIGLITLVWAASGGFINLAYNINLAWLEAPNRNFLQGRLLALEMIAGISGLFFLSLILDWIIHLLPFFNMPVESFSSLYIWSLFSTIFSWLTILLLFFALYYWVPTVNVKTRAAIWGALTASIIWKIGTVLFSWYLRSGFGRYELIYGSVGTIVAFLFLIYILATVTLFGAHLTAALDRKAKLMQKTGTITSSEDIKG